MGKPYPKETTRFISYLLYVVFIGYVIFLGSLIKLKLELLTATTGNNTPQFIFMAVFPVFIGIMLALPGFIAKLKDNGNGKLFHLVFVHKLCQELRRYCGKLKLAY